MIEFKQGHVPNLNWKKAVKKPLILSVAVVIYDSGNGVWVNTPEGKCVANNGDYIIKDYEGNQFICSKENFQIGHDVYNEYADDPDIFNIDFVDISSKKDATYNFFTCIRKEIEVEYAIIDDDFIIKQEKDSQHGDKGDIIIRIPGTNHFYRIYPRIFEKTYYIKLEEKYGVFLSRMSPFHLGHGSVIKEMVNDCGYEKSLVLIGSCSSKLNNRVTFTYSQRRQMLKNIFPNISVVGLPDYKHYDSDPEFIQWHENLWDIIKLKFPLANKNNIVFYGGDSSDVFFFKDYNVKIISRKNVNKKEHLLSGAKARTVIREIIDNKTQPNVLNNICHSENVEYIIETFKENIKKWSDLIKTHS